jgi:hypothetical protein
MRVYASSTHTSIIFGSLNKLLLDEFNSWKMGTSGVAHWPTTVFVGGQLPAAVGGCWAPTATGVAGAAFTRVVCTDGTVCGGCV